MARESVALLKGKIDVARVLDQLNAALSEEWLAYYQYWTAARMVTGAQRVDLKREFEEHAAEELEHASMLCDRIIELQGVPVLTPQEWYKHARCVYDTPTAFNSEYFLKTILIAEECAMRRYQELSELTEGKDYITNLLAKKILADEADHEQDMQDYLDDIATMRRLSDTK
ncbi:MAG: ferritin-like domain-containing protein [Muribaculaceae bacterium]|nr:ferritin-like domain-containing protein [Muribaculaceae bacterium]